MFLKSLALPSRVPQTRQFTTACAPRAVRTRFSGPLLYTAGSALGIGAYALQHIPTVHLDASPVEDTESTSTIR